VDQVLLGSRNHSGFLANQRRRRRTTRDPRVVATVKSDLWHLRMGYIRQWALHKLGKHVLGAKLRGPCTTECEDCALTKAKK
jgi:hypothetical protein